MSSIGSDSEAQSTISNTDDFEDQDIDESLDQEQVEVNDPSVEKTDQDLQNQRASRQEQRKLLLERKAAKKNGALIIELKKLWEIIRSQRTETGPKEEAMKKIMELITGKIKEVTFRHDAARVVQSALKHGNSAQRNIIASELVGSYVELASSRYGRFIVSKILNMCPKFRNDVIKEFYGQVRKLIKHKDASFVIEEAYSQFANSKQKLALIQEFYGPEYAVFKSETPSPLSVLLENSPLKKTSIVKHMREAINAFMEKEYNLTNYTIIHRLILDYALILPTPSEDPSASSHLIDLLKEALPQMIHTREGSRLAHVIISYASPKDRKVIMKSAKPHIANISTNQFASHFLIALSEFVDDTVFLTKTLLQDICTLSVCINEHGSKVLLYLLCGRDTKYIPMFFINEMKQLDETRKITSKKDSEVRRTELMNSILPPLVKILTTHISEVVRNKNSSNVLLEVLKHCSEEDRQILFKSIAALVDEDLGPTSGKPFNAVVKLSEADKVKIEHVLQDRTSTFTITKILKNFSGFAIFLADKLSPSLMTLMKKCVESPETTKGTVHIFIKILESGVALFTGDGKKTVMSMLGKRKSQDERSALDLMAKKLKEIEE